MVVEVLEKLLLHPDYHIIGLNEQLQKLRLLLRIAVDLELARPEPSLDRELKKTELRGHLWLENVILVNLCENLV